MTKKEIEALSGFFEERIKASLDEIEHKFQVLGDFYSRLAMVDKKLDGLDARIANLEDVFCKVEGQDCAGPYFPGTSHGRVALRANRIDNIEHYLMQFSGWIEGHPHCVCKDLVALQFDDHTGMVRNVTGPASWHCPVHGQVEVK